MDSVGAFSFPQWAATILAALMGALISGFMTYRYVVKRKRLTFAIAPTEDLTAVLRMHVGSVSIKTREKEVQRLSRAKVSVKNTGNSTIKDVEFSIVIDGEHSFVTADARGSSVKLSNAVQMKWQEGIDPVGEISVAFLNPKETLEIQMFFDGSPGRCMAHCRMEEVSVKYKTIGFDDAIGAAAALVEAAAPIGAGAASAVLKILAGAR